MRSAFQDSPDVSFVFLGSKRSLMDALFSDRRRPFYNFGRWTTLGRLAYDELGEFVERRFERADGRITPDAVDLLLDLTGGHPHRAQQIAFHAFDIAARRVDGDRSSVAEEETVLAAKERALDETAEEFRAVLDGMPPSAPRALRGPLQGTHLRAALEGVPQAPRHPRLGLGAQRLTGAGGRGRGGRLDQDPFSNRPALRGVGT
jgi:hypothetical protein